MRCLPQLLCGFILLSQAGASAGQREGNRIRLLYGASSEFQAFRLVIDGRKVVYTYNKGNSLVNKGEIVRAQRPHYTKADMVTIKTELSAADVQALIEVVRDSHFMTAADGKKTKTKTYPRPITISLDGKKKVLLGDGVKVPLAYRKVANYLDLLISRKVRKMKAPALF